MGILRTSCMATHEESQIKEAVEIIAEAGRRHKVIAA
jgi:hypothetical protein